MDDLETHFEMDIDVTVAGKHHGKLVMDEPNMGQMETAQEAALTLTNPISSDLAYVSAVSGLPVIVLKALPRRQFEKALEFLKTFTQPAPQTGNSSESN